LRLFNVIFKCTFRFIPHKFCVFQSGVTMNEYPAKFEILGPWIHDIFQLIKKELMRDAFVQKHLPKRVLDKLPLEEFSAMYLKEIAEGNEELGDKVLARWVLKHAELYHFFIEELSKVNPKYDEIVDLPSDVSSYILNTSVSRYGAVATYIFSILNAVVFTEDQLQHLREIALLEKSQAKPPAEEKSAFASIEEVHERYEAKMRKLVEKYEKRVLGIERKYVQDVEGLKKQIAELHRKAGGQPT
jgi:hypothetical protein